MSFELLKAGRHILLGLLEQLDLRFLLPGKVVFLPVGLLEGFLFQLAPEGEENGIVGLFETVLFDQRVLEFFLEVCFGECQGWLKVFVVV